MIPPRIPSPAANKLRWRNCPDIIHYNSHYNLRNSALVLLEVTAKKVLYIVWKVWATLIKLFAPPGVPSWLPAWVIMACDLYCCLLPQCEALRTCRAGFPIATLARTGRCTSICGAAMLLRSNWYRNLTAVNCILHWIVLTLTTLHTRTGSCITLLWLHHNHKMSISYHKNGLVSSHQTVRRWFIFMCFVVRMFWWN